MDYWRLVRIFCYQRSHSKIWIAVSQRISAVYIFYADIIRNSKIPDSLFSALYSSVAVWTNNIIKMLQLGFEDWIRSSSSSKVLGCIHIFAAGIFWQSHEAVTSEGPCVLDTAQIYLFLYIMSYVLRINWFTLLKSNCRMISTLVLEVVLLLLITVEDTPPTQNWCYSGIQ